MNDKVETVQVQISPHGALALIALLAGVVLLIVTLVTAPLGLLGGGFWVGFLLGVAGLTAGSIAICNGHRQAWVFASTALCGAFFLASIIVMMLWGTVKSAYNNDDIFDKKEEIEDRYYEWRYNNYDR